MRTANGIHCDTQPLASGRCALLHTNVKSSSSALHDRLIACLICRVQLDNSEGANHEASRAGNAVGVGFGCSCSRYIARRRQSRRDVHWHRLCAWHCARQVWPRRPVDLPVRSARQLHRSGDVRRIRIGAGLHGPGQHVSSRFPIAVRSTAAPTCHTAIARTTYISRST